MESVFVRTDAEVEYEHFKKLLGAATSIHDCEVILGAEKSEDGELIYECYLSGTLIQTNTAYAPSAFEALKICMSELQQALSVVNDVITQEQLNFETYEKVRSTLVDAIFVTNPILKEYSE